MPKKGSKHPKFGFFGHICYSYTFRILKFGMIIPVPPMNTHVKFQKPRFNSFGDIQFWNFSKFWDSLIFDFFLKKMKNMFVNFEKMNLLIRMKCIHPIPKIQRGTMTLRGYKMFQSWKKLVPKFCFFGHPRIFGNATAKRL